MNKEQRKSMLLYQFESSHLFNENNQLSLNRFLNYILDHSDILFLSFINENTFVDYLTYHQSNDFSIINFTQVIKDIKVMTCFLKNSKMYEVEADFSLMNYDLWLNLH